MNCELCEICSFKNRPIATDEHGEPIVMFDAFNNKELRYCSDRTHNCPGFKPGNIPKVIE